MYTPTDEEIRNAKEVLRQDYRVDVSRIAEEFQGKWEGGEFATREDAIEWLEETVDGSYRITYTVEAALALVWSDNDDAYADQIGGEATVEARAAFAMRQDVIDELDRLGIDVNDQPGPSEEDVAKAQVFEVAAQLGALVPNMAVSHDDEFGEITLDGGHHGDAVCIEVVRYNTDEWRVKTDIEVYEQDRDNLTMAQAIEAVVEMAAAWEETL